MAKKRKKRVKIPKRIEAKVLFANDHTCCMCHDSSKDVLIHHINEDPSDNRPENLAVVCTECNNRIHRKSSVSKGYSAAEVLHYKRLWEDSVAKRRQYLALPKVKETITEIDLSSGTEKRTEREVPYLDGLALKALEVVPQVKFTVGEGRALEEARHLVGESGSADRLLLIAARLKRDEAAHESRKMILSRLCLAIGDAKFHESNYGSAESYYQEALAYAESVNEASILEICLSELAAAVGMQGRHEQALEYLDRVVALNSDDPAAWYNRGISLLALNMAKDALAALTRAIELGREAEAWALVATSYLNAGVAYGKSGNLEEAIESFETAIDMGTEANEWSTVARAYYNAGRASEELGNHATVIEFCLKAIETGTRAGEWRTVADAHDLKGAAQLKLGKVREAIESSRMAVETATRARDWSAAADAWIGTALALVQDGQCEQALRSHMKAVDCAARAMDWSRVAKGWYGAALVQGEMGDHESAIKSYLQGIEAALRVNDPGLVGSGWYGLGAEQMRLERYREAIASGQQVIQFATKAEEWHSVARAHIEIGLAHHALDEHAEALDSYEKAIETGTREEAWATVGRAHFATGLVDRELGRFDEAIDSWRKALELREFYPDQGALVFSRMAECICVLGLQAAVEERLGRARQQARALAQAYFDAREGGFGQLVLEALTEFGGNVPNGQSGAFERFRQLVMDCLNDSAG
jgi:tetratricopeptide (TPR) repeat protein